VPQPITVPRALFIVDPREIILRTIFLFVCESHLYLQTVRVHSANGVIIEACRGALSSTPPHLTGAKPRVSVGKKTY
jgi:hypothetical protein